MDGGLPLLTVCASDRFRALHARGELPDAVFLAPVPLGNWDLTDALLAHAMNGGRCEAEGYHGPPTSSMPARINGTDQHAGTDQAADRPRDASCGLL